MTNLTGTPRTIELGDSDPLRLLLESARLIRSHFAAELHDTGLTEPQWRVLAFVARSEGLSQTELAALLGLHKVALGEHIERLLAMGYLRKAADPVDRRARRIYLAPAAASLTPQLQQRFSRFTRSLQHSLGNDWQHLERQLQDLAVALCAEQTLQALNRLTLQTSLHLVGVLARVLGRKLDEQLVDWELSHLQWLVLARIREQPGISQSLLGRSLAIRKAALGQLLDTLESAGWLLRQPDKHDRRVKCLLVGGQLKSQWVSLQRARRSLNRPLDDGLGGESVENFTHNLGRLRGCLVEYEVSQR